MRSTAQIRRIYDLLYAEYGDCVCPLKHRDVFELMCAVMLSAQCRDDRVNEVTVGLFRRCPSPEILADTAVSEVESMIRTLGLAHDKATHLVGAAKLLRDKFGGVVPRTMGELVLLPGIGRKSANVILGNGFGIPGFPVDTHVKRLCGRLGIAGKNDSPEKIEAIVTRRLAAEFWTNFSHLLITHGRRVCAARKPDCGNCVLCGLCPASPKELKS